jgi:hypothetical protein
MPASRNETADEPRIAEACQKRAADITVQVDDDCRGLDLAEAKSVRQPDEAAHVTHHRRLLAQAKEMSGPPRRAKAQRRYLL